MEDIMKIGKTLAVTTLGSLLLIGTSGYAMAQERWERGAERQEQIARSEIRRGKALEQEGYRLEREGNWRRGKMLEQLGEFLERHGHRMLRQAEWGERFGER